MPSLTIDEIRAFSKIPTNIFVETGTYYGDTTHEASKIYNRVYSIELSEHYHNLAKTRFQSNPNVHLLRGDSAFVLESLCVELNEPTLFWLDGHYSSGNTAKGIKDCPLYEEIKHIMKLCKPGCVITIDDVRLFGTNTSEDWLGITVSGIVDVVKDRMESISYSPSVLHPKDRMIIVLSPL